MKLHLGCGRRHIPGFVHIDAVPFDHVDHVHAVDHLPMVADNSVDLIYACHVLEHFWPREIQHVLGEWFRVLRSDGLLRVAVPDFEAVVIAYSRGLGLGALHGLLFGRGDGLYNVHHQVFDEQTLRAVLGTAGFVGAVQYDWRNTEHAGVDDYSQAYLPHLDKARGLLMSLNMEARKP